MSEKEHQQPSNCSLIPGNVGRTPKQSVLSILAVAVFACCFSVVYMVLDMGPLLIDGAGIASAYSIEEVDFEDVDITSDALKTPSHGSTWGPRPQRGKRKTEFGQVFGGAALGTGSGPSALGGSRDSRPRGRGRRPRRGSRPTEQGGDTPGQGQDPGGAASERRGRGPRSGRRPRGTTRRGGGAALTPGCNLFEGSWVLDDRRPLYSGLACPFIAKNWACRNVPARPSFEYERWRWQPSGCNLPDFNASDFLNRMRNKVLVFYGDSLGQQQFQSLLCLISQRSGEMPVKVGEATESAGAQLEKAKGLQHYLFASSNTTVGFAWSRHLVHLEPIQQAGEGGAGGGGALTGKENKMHIDRPSPFITEHLGQGHYLVLNTGHHWNRGKIQEQGSTVYYQGSVARDPSKPDRLMMLGEARKLSARAVLEAIEKQMEGMDEKPLVFLRSLSPRHFFGGEWNSGGSCDAETMSSVNNATDFSNDKRMTDRVFDEALKGRRFITYLNITFLSQFRPEAHLSKYSSVYSAARGIQDCLHWCIPGIPDVWNELLYGTLVMQQESAKHALV